MNSSFVFIESNTSGTGRLFASTAARLGFTPVMLALDPGRYSYIKEDGIHCIQVDTNDQLALEHCLDEFQETCRVAGIYSSSEYFIETAAALAHRYRLHGENAETIRLCRNKYLQRQALRRAHVHIPHFDLASSPQQLCAVLAKLRPPVVLKPNMGTGSIGVRLCRTLGEAVAHAAFLFAQRTNERGLCQSPEVLIEEYICGHEYSVEIMGRAVIGICAKYLSPEPFFVETGHDFPAAISGSIHHRIGQLALASIRAVDLGWGPVHVEIRDGANGPVVIEINPRLAGGFIPELVRLSTGFDLIEATIRLAAGQPVVVHGTAQRYASIRFIVSPAEGVLEALEAPATDVDADEMAEIKMYRRKGEQIRIHHDFRDRIGHVIVCAKSPNAAQQKATITRDGVRVCVTGRTSGCA